MSHYTSKKIQTLLNEYNKPFAAPFYFERFLKHIKEAIIADLGSGPVCTIGSLWGNVKLKIYASDILANEYNKTIAELNAKPITPVEYQDMENLTYPDEFFDVVHSINALDHTENVKKALDEMFRICKPGGYIYLRHGHNQLKINGGRGHFWNATNEGFTNGREIVPLEGFKTTDDGYFLVSILKKP